MGLIDIPSYVLAGEPPPHHRTRARAFHLLTWELPAPVEFPREVVADALAVHARLLDENGDDLLAAPVIEDGEADFFAPHQIGFACALLASEGVAVEIHKWRRQEVSYVVQRCRGIVRQLLEVPPLDRMYVVVVAAGAASLHLVRAHSPRRVGDRPRLEVVERALVVEPWEQWHRRVGNSIVTTWKTPAGEAVASRVPVPRTEWTVRNIVDALAHRYEASARKGLAAYRPVEPGDAPAVHLMTEEDGETLYFHPRCDVQYWAKGFPEIARAARRDRLGLTPVVIDALQWGALVWLATGSADVATPAPVFEWNEMAGPSPGPSVANLVSVPHRGPVSESRRRPQVEAEPGPEYWRESLAKSLARLVRLTDLRAPVEILRHERRLARERIAKLEPADAEAVLSAWPRAVRLLARDPEASPDPQRGSEKPN